MFFGNQNKFQKQTVFNQLLLPLLQLGVALVMVYIGFMGFSRLLWLLGELQLLVFFVAATIAFMIEGKYVALTLTGLGCYSWVSLVLWNTDYLTINTTWAQARIGQAVVMAFVPIGAYIVIWAMLTDIQFPNLKDSITGFKVALKRRFFGYGIETPETEEEDNPKPFKLGA